MLLLKQCSERSYGKQSCSCFAQVGTLCAIIIFPVNKAGSVFKELLLALTLGKKIFAQKRDFFLCASAKIVSKTFASQKELKVSLSYKFKHSSFLLFPVAAAALLCSTYDSLIIISAETTIACLDLLTLVTAPAASYSTIIKNSYFK